LQISPPRTRLYQALPNPRNYAVCVDDPFLPSQNHLITYVYYLSRRHNRCQRPRL
jgi:hypothetical protein